MKERGNVGENIAIVCQVDVKKQKCTRRAFNISFTISRTLGRTELKSNTKSRQEVKWLQSATFELAIGTLLFTTAAHWFKYLHSFNEAGAVKRESHHCCQTERERRGRRLLIPQWGNLKNYSSKKAEKKNVYSAGGPRIIKIQNKEIKKNNIFTQQYPI